MEIIERKITLDVKPPDEKEIEKEVDIYTVGQEEPVGFFGHPFSSVGSNTNEPLTFNPVHQFNTLSSMSSATSYYYDANPVVKIEEIKCKMDNGKLLVYEERTHKNGEKRYRVNSADFKENEFISYFIDENFVAEDVINLWNIEQKSSIVKHFGFERIFTDETSELIDTMEDVSVVNGKPIKYELYDVVVSKDPDIVTRIVRVEDCSTNKFAYLSVPRIKDTNTCKKAVAWTFGMKPSEYKPQYEA